MEDEKSKPAIDVCVVIGWLIVKHKQNLSVEQTNKIINYEFLVPSLFVVIKRRQDLKTLKTINDKHIEEFKRLEQKSDQNNYKESKSKKKANPNKYYRFTFRYTIYNRFKTTK